MRRILFCLTVFFVSMAFTLGVSLSCMADAIYFNADHQKISEQEYNKIRETWQMQAKENIAQREAMATDEANNSEANKGLKDPVQIRKKRLEQWKAFRGEM